MLLLTIYFFLLEKEKIYKFNRFYLLFGLVFSVLVPFIPITIYGEVASVIEVSEVNSSERSVSNTTVIPLETAPEPQQDYFLPILLIVYSIITAFFLYRFIKNIYFILITAHRNKKVSYQGAILVLTKDTAISHTFLNYIFINEEEYKANAIEKQLLSHELTHVNQKHTLDILLVELLYLFLWFNPILILYKKAIQLNHEFLADESVLSIYKGISDYQVLLLSKIGLVNTIPLTHSFNYLITKKRLVMMTKQVNKTRTLFKKIALLPLLSLLLFLFSTKVVAQKDKNQETVTSVVAESSVDMTDKSLEPEKKGRSQAESDINSKSEKKIESVLISDKKMENANRMELKEEKAPVSVQQFTSVEVAPQFPGGMEKFRKFIMANIYSPPTISGTTKVTFYIDKDGTVEIPASSRESDGINKNAIITVLAKSPKWRPAVQNGRFMKVGYVVTVHFKVEIINGDKVNFIVADKVDMINEEMVISFEKTKKNGDIHIQGTVLNKDGEPMVGVSIRSADSKAGTASGNDGHFSLALPDSESLTFSCVGYATKRIDL